MNKEELINALNLNKKKINYIKIFSREFSINAFNEYQIHISKKKKHIKLDNIYSMNINNNDYFSLKSLPDEKKISLFSLDKIVLKIENKEYENHLLNINDIDKLFYFDGEKTIFAKKRSTAIRVIKNILNNQSLPIKNIIKANRFIYSGEYMAISDLNNLGEIIFNEQSFVIKDNIYFYLKEDGCNTIVYDKNNITYIFKCVSFDFKGNPVFTLIKERTRKLIYRFSIKEKKV